MALPVRLVSLLLPVLLAASVQPAAAQAPSAASPQTAHPQQRSATGRVFTNQNLSEFENAPISIVGVYEPPHPPEARSSHNPCAMPASAEGVIACEDAQRRDEEADLQNTLATERQQIELLAARLAGVEQQLGELTSAADQDAGVRLRTPALYAYNVLSLGEQATALSSCLEGVTRQWYETQDRYDSAERWRNLVH